MSRPGRRRNIIIALLLLTLLAMVGIIGFLPTLATGALESRVTAALHERGVDSEWESLKIGWGGAVEMRGVRIDDPDRGILLEAERLRVDPSISGFFNEDPRIDDVEVRGATLTVDLARVERAIDKASAHAPSAPPSSPTEETARALLVANLIHSPPDIVLERVALVATRDGAPLVRFETEETTFAADGGDLTFTTTSSMQPTWEKLPRILRQPRSWTITGTFSPAALSGALTLAAAREGLPLIDVSLPRIGRATVGELTMEGVLAPEDGAPRRLDVGAEALHIKVGDVDEHIASLDAAHLTTDMLGIRPTIEARGVLVEVAPAKLSEVRRLKDRLEPAALLKRRTPSRRAPSTRAAISAQLAQIERIGVMVSDLATAVDLHADEATIAAHLRLGGDTPQRIELVNDLSVDLVDGLLTTHGASSGGTFEALASFVPGRAWPASASLVAREVEIEELPGMSEGRTLPNRGVRGRLGGTLDVSLQWMRPQTRDYEEAILDGALRWREGMVYLSGLSEEPLEGLEVEASGRMHWAPHEGRLTLEDAEVATNGVRADMSAELVDWPLEPVFTFTASMPETSCQAMVDAIPEALLGPYEDVLVEGEMAPVFTLEYPLNTPQYLEIDITGLAEEGDPDVQRERRRAGEEPLDPIDKTYYCRVENLRADKEGWPDVRIADAPGSMGQAKAKAQPPSWRHDAALGDVYWLNKPFIKRVTEGVSEEALEPDSEQAIYVGPGLESYVPLQEMPRWVPAAAYLSEEILFMTNRGISVGLIQKALRINMERERFVYGGSTVTQQLVKNLFLTRTKTLSRKLQETFISLRIDEVVSKERVIELYLNCIEYGPDLYGIGPAARHYFGKDARDLTPMEAVFLAIIKPDPSYGEFLRTRRGSMPDKGWFKRRIETMFRRFHEYEIMTEEEAERLRPYTLEWDDEGVYMPKDASTADDPMRQLEKELGLDLFGDGP